MLSAPVEQLVAGVVAQQVVAQLEAVLHDDVTLQAVFLPAGSSSITLCQAPSPVKVIRALINKHVIQKVCLPRLLASHAGECFTESTPDDGCQAIEGAFEGTKALDVGAAACQADQEQQRLVAQCRARVADEVCQAHNAQRGCQQRLPCSAARQTACVVAETRTPCVCLQLYGGRPSIALAVKAHVHTCMHAHTHTSA